MPVPKEVLDKIADYEKQGYSHDEIVQGLGSSQNYPDVATKIKDYQGKGYASPDIIQGIKTSPIAGPETSKKKSRALPPGLENIEDIGFMRAGPEIKEFLTNPKKVGRLATEGLGAASGSMLGGPWLGGPLGFAFGDKLADIIWGGRELPKSLDLGVAQVPLENRATQELGQTASDFGTGLLYEAGGKAMDLAGKGLGATIDAVKGIKTSGVMPWINEQIGKVAEKQAAKTVATATSKVPAVEAQVGKNVQAAEGIETSIPGLRFNLGQKTGDPNLLSLSRTQSQKAGPSQAMSGESVMNQNEALRSYIKDHIRGGGKMEDFLGTVEGKQKGLAASTEKAGKAVETEAQKLSGAGDQEVGATLLEKAKQGRTASSQEAKRLYDKVPDDLPVDATPLWDKVESLFGGFDPLTQRLGATPTGPMSRIKEAMKPTLLDEAGKPIVSDMPAQLTMKQVKDFRSQLGYAQKSALVNKDYELAYKLGELRDGVNEALSNTAKSGEGPGVKALQDATTYWRDTHVPKFRQGPTGKILEATKTGEGKVAGSEIGSQYFKPGKGAAEAADNFNYVFGGDPEAKGMIRDYAAQSMLKYSRNHETGELSSKKVMDWLYQHNTALDKLGLKGEFGDVQKALKVADEARGMEAAFNKSALAKTLDKNPDIAIDTALMTGASKQQSIQRLKEMADLARTDKTGSALAGLKAGIGDYFNRKTLNTARDLAERKITSLAKVDSLMDTFMPALEKSGLYSKAELEAFDNVHKAVQTISKQQTPVAGFVGSPTAEIMSRMAASGTSIALGHMGIYGASLGIFQRAFKWVAQEEMDKALARAVFDPQYAQAISGFAYNVRNVAKQMKPGSNMSMLDPQIQSMATKFKNQLSALGLMAVGQPGNINRDVAPDLGRAEQTGQAKSGTIDFSSAEE